MKISIELTFEEIIDMIKHRDIFDGRPFESIKPIFVPKDCGTTDIGESYQEIKSVIFTLGDKPKIPISNALGR